MRRDEQRRMEELEELIRSHSNGGPVTVDDELSAAAELASELRRHATAPPSPRQAALRAELLAHPPIRRHRRIMATPGLAAVLVALSAGVAFASLPAAAPIREAISTAVEGIFESGTIVTTPAEVVPGGQAAPDASAAVTPSPLGSAWPTPALRPITPAEPTQTDAVPARSNTPAAATAKPHSAEPPVPTPAGPLATGSAAPRASTPPPAEALSPALPIPGPASPQPSASPNAEPPRR